MHRAAHVNVNPVRRILLYQCGGSGHEFRFAAKQLDAHGTFRLCDGAQFTGALVSIAKTLDRNHFTYSSGCAEAAAQKPVRTVCHACHRCQDCRLGKGNAAERKCRLLFFHENSPLVDHLKSLSYYTMSAGKSKLYFFWRRMNAHRENFQKLVSKFAEKKLDSFYEMDFLKKNCTFFRKCAILKTYKQESRFCLCAAAFHRRNL